MKQPKEGTSRCSNCPWGKGARGMSAPALQHLEEMEEGTKRCCNGPGNKAVHGMRAHVSGRIKVGTLKY